MNLISRLKRLEKDLHVNDNYMYIRIGKPCFTLYGDEARAYVEKERAAGRLLKPSGESGSGNIRFNVHRRKGPSPEELRDAEC